MISLYLKVGKPLDAKKLKHKLQEARYEIEMLDAVMNLDFTRPKEKNRLEALEQGVDLTDPRVIEEFKKL